MNRDPLETCPYDPVHRILRSRMQFHLTRCSKNFPNTKKKQCPFDTRHVVNEVEYQYHVSHCSARESVVSYQLNDPDADAQIRLLPINNVLAGPADEDWENDTNVKSYNPLQNIMERPVVVPTIGLSKARRKEHRLQERIRFGAFKDDEKNQDQSQDNAQMNGTWKRENPRSAQTDDESGDQAYKPLRRPKNMSLNSSATVSNKKPENSALDTTAQGSTRPSSTMSINGMVNNISRPSSTMSVSRTSADVSFNQAAGVDKTSGSKNTSRNLEDEDDKENVLDRTSDSIFNKTKESVLNLSRTIEQMQISSDGYNRKNEELDKKLGKWQKESDVDPGAVNELDKKSRCAANFENTE